MIYYNPRTVCIVLRRLPIVLRDKNIWKASALALPSAIVAWMLEYYETDTNKNWWRGVFMDKVVYSGVSFLICFMVFMRIRRSYRRFFNGCEKAFCVIGCWYDAMSLCVAFSRHSKTDRRAVEEFHHLLIRVVSLLLSCVFHDLQQLTDKPIGNGEGLDNKFPVLDLQGIDPKCIEALSKSEGRVEIVFNWVQSLLVDKMAEGILNVPPPILTRVYHELGDGIIKYHEALHVCRVPFPFPLAVVTECLLVLQTCVTPLVIISWTDYITCATLFSFLFVFILWYFNGIATALENPFAGNMHALATIKMQSEQNLKLLTLMLPEATRVPRMKESALWDDARMASKSMSLGKS